MAEDADFGDEDPDFADDDDGFGDDDGFDDGGGDDWGDAVEDDGFAIKHDEKELAKQRLEKQEAEENKELQNAEWTCLECKHVNKGMGLLCLGCNKPNLGELDRQKRKRELKEGQYWYDVLKETYIPLQRSQKKKNGGDADLVLKTAEDYLRSLFVHELVDRRIPDMKKYSDKDLKTKCESCTCDFDEKEVSRAELTCHGNICKGCCGNWIRAKISDENVIPFIRCPAEDCDYAIPVFLYIDAATQLKLTDMYRLLAVYSEKQLARNANWISCSNSKSCKYGFLLQLSESEKDAQCDNCGTKQHVKRKTEFDEGFNEMLKSGKIRMCPKCKFPHMKDFGLCNVLQCGKCKMWWNWRTMDMDNTQKGLKAKARQQRTLWEPGELEWQMKLQRDDPAAFQHLLESNGVKYDPNYTRGQ
eukprot:CAMPEP_0202709928 /NCGR_PEP_ID=MMETSP1385-20130828/21974_1 /ASSEMBLY_ACC=CAM_ASM_000861 /TAXON_ID=933848 /ORGANISM="Elphidium margaritaceum" /LENGTH=415 /DNA_ID=CAMNT_0049369317 /DNA_START=29 /DNA_END=1276 /DNA_ORIENTATION=-